MANYMSMEDWINVYDGDLGTVLTDTYTTDVFLGNFSKKHAALFTSLRHDSGDPYLFVDKVIRRYEELRVNPRLKYLVFSDSLNVRRRFKSRSTVATGRCHLWYRHQPDKRCGKQHQRVEHRDEAVPLPDDRQGGMAGVREAVGRGGQAHRQ